MSRFDISAWYTVVMFVVFIGIFVWAWSGKRKKDFAEAASLPFSEPDQPVAVNKKEASHE